MAGLRASGERPRAAGAGDGGEKSSLIMAMPSAEDSFAGYSADAGEFSLDWVRRGQEKRR